MTRVIPNSNSNYDRASLQAGTEPHPPPDVKADHDRNTNNTNYDRERVSVRAALRIAIPFKANDILCGRRDSCPPKREPELRSKGYGSVRASLRAGTEPRPPLDGTTNYKWEGGSLYPPCCASRSLSRLTTFCAAGGTPALPNANPNYDRVSLWSGAGHQGRWIIETFSTGRGRRGRRPS
jgi:hypothetical protein